jgi:hypothetical protein
MNTELTKVTEEQAKEIGLPSPQAVEYMMSIANMLLTSALITPDMEPPKEAIQALVAAKWEQKEIDLYRDQVIKSNAMAKMLVGREMGMQTMESLQDVDIVKGKIFVRYPQLFGQIVKKGCKVKQIERSEKRAAVEVTRPDMEDPEVYEFTIEDAKRAGLTSGGKPEYNQYLLRPRVMLWSRLISEVYRAVGGRSNIYTQEEKAEVTSSTMDAPTESDQRRVEVLQAQEEKYKVGLKATVEPIKETAPQTTNVVEMPTKAADPKPEPVGQEVTKEPEPKPIQYEIHVMMATAGNSKLKPVICPNETQLDKTAASLRAQAMANDTGHIHVVVQFDPSAQDRGETCRSEVARCHPPKKQATPAADKPAPPQETKPELAPEPEPEPKAAEKAPDAAKAAAKERLEALVPIVGIPGPTAMRRFTAYMAGFVGCPLKEFTAQPLDKRMAALESLEYTIRADKEEFNSGPEQSGERRAKRYNSVLEFLTNLWKGHPDTIALGMKLFQQWDQSAEQFQKWVQMDNIELDFRPMDDVHASIRLLLRTREGAYLMKTCKDHNLSVAACLDQIEKRALMAKVEDAPASSIENAIKAYIQTVKEELRKPVAKPEPEPVPEPEPPAAEPEPPAAEGEGEDDNLFGNTTW